MITVGELKAWLSEKGKDSDTVEFYNGEVRLNSESLTFEIGEPVCEEQEPEFILNDGQSEGA